MLRIRRVRDAAATRPSSTTWSMPVLESWQLAAARIALIAAFAASFAGAQDSGQATLPPRDITENFELAPGFDARVTLWAESPDLYNPTAMDFDSRGRLFVTEAVNYRKWNGRNPGREHPKGDRVLLLEDTDQDGRHDKTTVFAQSKSLVAPLGITVLDTDRVLVACSPNLLLFTDDDGDGRADREEVFLTGFGGYDHDHGLHSFSYGPDGYLYCAIGNAGPHIVEDRAGKLLQSGSFYSGGGPERVDNEGGLRSDDGRVWVGGLVLRMNVDGTGLQVLADNCRNPYEVAVDAFGDMFLADNDDDGNRACRTAWAYPLADFGYASADGSRHWRVDRQPGQSVLSAHWRQDDPGVAASGTINGGGGPTGVCILEAGRIRDRSTRFWHQDYDGSVLNCDAGRGVVYVHRPKLEGAGFQLAPGVLLAARSDLTDANGTKRPARWFRPSDVTVGPDGAIYVADWYDPGVGGHGARDREAYGRILRIAPREWPGARKMDSDLVAALHNPNAGLRGRSFHAVLAANTRPAKVLPALQDPSPRVRARAVFLLARVGGDPLAAREDADPRVRVAAFRAAVDTASTEQRLPLLQDFARDPDPGVRRAVLLQLAQWRSTLQPDEVESCLKLWVELAKSFQGNRTYLDALGHAAEQDGERLYPRIVAELGAQPLAWSKPFAALVWRLHPDLAIPALRERALARTLSTADRRQALITLSFCTDRSAAGAVVEAAQAGPESTRELAAFLARSRSKTTWRGLDIAQQLGATVDDTTVAFRSDVVRKPGLYPIAVDVRSAQHVWLVANDAGDGISHDWANWIAPRFERADGTTIDATKGLDLSAKPNVTGWGQFGNGRNAAGKPLQVAGKTYGLGIGCHTNSRVRLTVPEGAVRFVADCGLDDGGTSQPGSRPSVRFIVRIDQRRERTDLRQWQDDLLGSDPAAATRAARELATDPTGAMALLNLAAQERLPDSVRPIVAQTIFTNPEPRIRALATRHFERPGAAGIPLPPLPEIAAMTGDARRGEELFHGRGTCGTCHRVDERGTPIGPDLDRIDQKFDRLGLLDSMVDPSAAIAFGYDVHTVTTTGGETHSGFLLVDGSDVVLQTLTGQRQVLAADSIRERSKQATSIMPPAPALGLGARELADLCAYLLAPRDPLATDNLELGAPVELFNGRDLSGWTSHFSKPPETPVFRAEDGILKSLGRPRGYLRTKAKYRNFVLTLQWRFPAKPGNGGVLVRAIGQDKVWPKSIEAQLQSRNAGDIWNIDRVGMLVAADRTKGRRTKKLAPTNERPLGEWNHYEITLRDGDLRLVVNGLVQNRATDCDAVDGWICLQAEGAAMEFRNIILRPILN